MPNHLMLLLILSGVSVTFGAGVAQQPPAMTTDGAPPVTSPSQIDKDASAILPSAGSSGPSAAPTMIRDCVKNPQDCTKPPGPGDKATAEGEQSTGAIQRKP